MTVSERLRQRFTELLLPHDLSLFQYVTVSDILLEFKEYKMGALVVPRIEFEIDPIAQLDDQLRRMGIFYSTSVSLKKRVYYVSDLASCKILLCLFTAIYYESKLSSFMERMLALNELIYYLPFVERVEGKYQPDIKRFEEAVPKLVKLLNVQSKRERERTIFAVLKFIAFYKLFTKSEVVRAFFLKFLRELPLEKRKKLGGVRQ